MLALRARHFFVPNDEGADPLKFSIYVRAGSAMPISRAARIQEAETLFAMGALDPQAVLEAHDYPNRQMILQRLNSMAQLGIEPKENKGKRNRQR